MSGVEARTEAGRCPPGRMGTHGHVPAALLVLAATVGVVILLAAEAEATHLRGGTLS